MITADEFFRAEIRAGVVLRAERFPEASEPACRLWIANVLSTLSGSGGSR